jgi:type I restriction enzyme S subunit
VFDTITTRTLESAKILVATENVMDAFEAAISPLYHRVLINCQASLTLSALRDLLLPKLMSGELQVKEAEQSVAAVT